MRRSNEHPPHIGVVDRAWYGKQLPLRYRPASLTQDLPRNAYNGVKLANIVDLKCNVSIIEDSVCNSRMLESSPNASDIWLARARRLARRSDWQATADAFIHSAELRLPESETWFEASCAMRIAGNEEAYRELVSTFLEQLGEQPERNDGFVFSRTIGLASHNEQLAKKAVLLAQAAVDEANES